MARLSAHMGLVMMCFNIFATMLVLSGTAAVIDVAMDPGGDAAIQGVKENATNPKATAEGDQQTILGARVSASNSVIGVMKLMIFGLPTFLENIGAPSWMYTPLYPLTITLVALDVVPLLFRGDTI